MVALERRIKHSDGRSIVELLREKNGLSAKATVGVISANVCDRVSMKSAASGSDIEALATTDNVDLDSEVVLPGGMDAKSYLESNKSLFVDHRYFIEFCVGKIRRILPWTVGGKLKGHTMKGWLMPDEASPYAKAVRTLIDAGGCGVSIGFQALDCGLPTPDERKMYPGAESIVRAWKLLEVSFTAMPCNVACQSMQASMDEGKGWAMKSALRHLGDSVVSAFGLDGCKDAPAPPKRRRIVIVD